MKPSKDHQMTKPAAETTGTGYSAAAQLNRESKNDSVISAGENKVYLAIDTK